jgi:Flp pilus assembly pilin Flp
VEVGVSFRGGGSVFLVSSFGAVSLSLFGVVWFEFSVLRFVGEFCGSTSVGVCCIAVFCAVVVICFSRGVFWWLEGVESLRCCVFWSVLP